MYQSYLGRFNATLYYTILDPTPADFDEVTGKPIFNETIKKVRLSIETEEDVLYSNEPGIDLQTLPIYGRFEGAKLPKEIRPKEVYFIDYEYSLGQTVRGKLIFDLETTSRLQLEAYFGIPFFGQLTLGES